MQEAISARTFQYPVKYNIAAVILYLISIEINNLKTAIREKSPQASQASMPDSIFTPEQIQEARKHPTGFVKSAISSVAKRQAGLNSASTCLQDLKPLIAEVSESATSFLQDTTLMSESEFAQLQASLQALKKQENDIVNIETTLRTIGATINDLIAKHRDEWRMHQQTFASKVAEELKQRGTLLSELEKQELSEGEKTLDAIEKDLQKYGLIKESGRSKKDTDLQLRTMQTLADAQQRQLEAIDPQKIKDMIKGLSSIKEEVSASSDLKTKQSQEYAEIITEIDGYIKLLEKIEILLPQEIRDLIENAKRKKRAQEKKVAASVAQPTAGTEPEPEPE